jgi:hypothetical protein
MLQTTLTKRNKNAHKTPIDYDLNIYMPEELDDAGNSYWDPASWRIHVYTYNDGNSQEYGDDPIQLTAEEIIALGLNQDEYFRTETDTWYGLYGFRLEYWDRMSNRLKEYFDRLPRYWEDMIV